MTLLTELTDPELFSAVFAGIAILISSVTYFRNKTIVKAQIYIDLRYRFIGIFDRLPSKYNSESWLPEKGTEDWVRIQEYWYHVFNEWFITNKVDRWQLHSLWRKYYKNAIYSGLQNRPLRYVLAKMFMDEWSFAGHNVNFEKVMDQIWMNQKPGSSNIRNSI